MAGTTGSKKKRRGGQATPTDDKLLRLLFFHPRFWLTWLQFGLLRIAAAQPPDRRDWIGAKLGDWAWRFAFKARHTVLRNLELAFPELTEQQRRELAQANFRNMGIGLMDIGVAWWCSDDVIAKMFEVKGDEHLRAAQKSGKGVLLLSCHMTGLEISGAKLRHLTNFKVLYREDRNPLIANFVRRSRRRRVDGVIANHDMRAMMRALKSGEVIWYAPDQNISPRRGGIFAPFLGIDAATTPASARLAQRTGCVVLPYYPKRLSGGGYMLIFEPPLADFPGGDIAQATTRINQTIEKWVREQPEQYFWAHKRFKSRPDGEPKLY